VERGGDIATVNADVLGDGAEDLALAARLGRDADLTGFGEIELRGGFGWTPASRSSPFHTLLHLCGVAFFFGAP